MELGGRGGGLMNTWNPSPATPPHPPPPPPRGHKMSEGARCIIREMIGNCGGRGGVRRMHLWFFPVTEKIEIIKDVFRIQRGNAGSMQAFQIPL